MKKIFTLVSVALVAMTMNAQTETWDAASVTDLTVAEQTFENASANVSLKIASYLNEKDIQDGKTPWTYETTANEALNTEACSPQFLGRLKGNGNPYVVDNGGYWEGEAYRDDPNAEVWTEGCGKLPLHGTYISFTTKTAGTMKLAVYVNKNNQSTYIVDAETGKHIAASDIKVAFYYQNNGFTFDDNGTTVSLVEGTMPDDFIIQHTNGYTQNRPALGYMTFSVDANKTYYAFCPKSQLGLYGYEFTPGEGGETGIAGVEVEEENDPNAPVYNLAGQRVGKDAKGILIQNGKKFIRK